MVRSTHKEKRYLIAVADVALVLTDSIGDATPNPAAVNTNRDVVSILSLRRLNIVASIDLEATNLIKYHMTASI